MPKRSKFTFVGLLGLVCIFTFGIAAALSMYAWHTVGRPLTHNGNDWAAFGEFVGGVWGPAFAVVNISVIIFIAYVLHEIDAQREQESARAQQSAREAAEERARRDRAIALHEYFLSPDFYSKVRAPAFQVGLTWMQLEGNLKEVYRDAVVRGWRGNMEDYALDLYVPQLPSSEAECVTYHFQTPKGLPSLTEHQALTAMLRFWTRTRILIDLKMIDRNLVRSLFKDEFGYQRTFLDSLSGAVSKLHGEDKPRWVEDLRILGEIFDSTNPR